MMVDGWNKQPGPTFAMLSGAHCNSRNRGWCYGQLTFRRSAVDEVWLGCSEITSSPNVSGNLRPAAGISGALSSQQCTLKTQFSFHCYRISYTIIAMLSPNNVKKQKISSLL